VSSVVVLLGPPGSGKTTVGEELGRLGFRIRDVAEKEAERRIASRERGGTSPTTSRAIVGSAANTRRRC